MSKEPSMEEILSSIKRIIAEDGDDAEAAVAPRERRARSARDSGKKGSVQDNPPSMVDEILELTSEAAVPYDADDSLPEIDQDVDAEFEALETAMSQNAPIKRTIKSETVTQPTAGIVSPASESAARASLATLSQMIVKPEPEGGDNTLEGLVRAMLRPLLKEWLDAHLPELVEGMVAKEIARITGRAL
ncbi:hypothetical protein FHS92_000226 [Sphingobium subterraneum]|uniref:DUF2497 domain-containing protein n=2 Tax=Sphingobium subterraneum TaxID=627688 RepID=A0A841IUC1_9SPHN|nr:hypothetical protein [Sphingobium subterraneum]